MGSFKEESDMVSMEPKKPAKIPMACFLLSFLISMVGGTLLMWWELEYHRSQSQLWMVPLGLLLFATPLIVWFSVFVSDICTSLEVDVSCPNGLVV